MTRWKFTTARQYAEHCGLDYQMVLELIHAGVIPALETSGKHYRIDQAMADAALEAEMRRPKPLPSKEQKVRDELGRTANGAVIASGGFTASLKELLA